MRLRLFDTDADGRLSADERAAAREAEGRARRDPETVMLYEELRAAHRALLEARSEGDAGWETAARVDLEEARSEYLARRADVLTAGR